MSHSLIAHLRYAVAAALLVGLTACDKEPTQPLADGDTPPSLLVHVPADTSYVFGNLHPVPHEMVTKLLGIYEEVLGMYREMLAGLEAEATDEEEAKFLSLADGLLAELQGNMSLDGLARLGLRSDGRAMVFGQGLYPVGRHEIADGAKVWDFIARVERQLGKRALRAQHGSVEYLLVEMGAVKFVLGTSGEQLVWAIVPTDELEARLPTLFGDQRPARNLHHSGQFQGLLSEHGLPGYGDGYVDLRSLFERLKSLEVEGVSLAAQEPGCVAFVEDLLIHVPRIVAGTKEANAKGVSVMTLVETDAQIGEVLSGLGHPVPGLGQASPALFALGVGVEVPKLRGALRDFIRYLSQAGAQCRWIDGPALQAAVPKLDMALGPMTAMFKGLYLELLDLQLDNGGAVPPVVKLRALAEVDDPQGVFAMTGMLNPELARLEVPTNGTPTQIPVALLPPGVPPLVVAIKDRSLVVAAGADGAALAAELLATPPVTPAPLLSFTYNFERLGGLMGAAADRYVELLAAQGGQSPERLRADLQTTGRLYAAYKSASMTLSGGKAGIRIDQAVEFK